MRRISPRSIAWCAIAAAGLGGWLLSFGGGDMPRVWRALLVNFAFFNSLASGLLCWGAIMTVAGARWHSGIERIPTAAVAFAIPSLTSFVLLWVGSAAWAPWHGAELHHDVWLNPTFIFARNFAGLALLWWCGALYVRRHRSGGATAAAGWYVFVFCIVLSLLGFDLVMGLDPHWFSSLFGGYYFISALYIGAAAWALVAATSGRARPKQRQDLGNLVLAFSVLTSAMLYAQLLTIWYENLPEETRYLIPRMNFLPWRNVSVFLLASVYLGPLVMLLTVWVKQSRVLLSLITVFILGGMWVERWWLIAPLFQKEIIPGVPELSLLVFFTGLCGFGLDRTTSGTGESFGHGEGV